MTRIEQVLRAITAALSGRERQFALVGGLAISARTEPRFTRDVDLAVVVADDADAEALVHALVGDGYVVVAAIEQEALQRLATVRLSPRGGSAQGVVADLLMASSGIEAEVAAGSQVLEILPGLAVPVASIGHLIALKTLSHGPNRPKDLLDLRALLGVATPGDMEQARGALAAIEARGFNRGKKLLDELETLLGPRYSALPPREVRKHQGD